MLQVYHRQAIQLECSLRELYSSFFVRWLPSLAEILNKGEVHANCSIDKRDCPDELQFMLLILRYNGLCSYSTLTVLWQGLDDLSHSHKFAVGTRVQAVWSEDGEW